MRRLFLSILLLAPLAACGPITTTVGMGPLKVDPAAAPGDPVSRELWIFGGAATTAMRLDLEVAKLPLLPPDLTNAWLVVNTGSGTEVQRIFTNGTHTSSEVAGNLVRLKVVAAAGAVIPEVTLKEVTLTRARASDVPDDAAQPADRLTAVPLPAGQTVDLVFPAGSMRYFFSFQAPRDGVYDFAYFGPGTLRVQGANEPYPVLSDSVRDTVPRPGSTVPFTRVSMARDEVRRMAVETGSAGGPGGRGRLVVMEAGEMQRLAFPSGTPLHYVLIPTGVDRGGVPGNRGPFGGELDCLNYQGQSPIAPVPPPPLPAERWVMAPRVPPCYRGHQGTDWPLRLGPAGQLMGATANAAAPGVVLAVDDTHFDKCMLDPFSDFRPRCISGFLTTAPPVDNFVAVRHDDGLIAYYVHGATGAASVVPGQRVACGELLTRAGSAGYSAGPHLHFELRQVPEGSFRGDPFTTLVLIPPQGSSDVSIRARSTAVDPFGPTSRWRSLGPGDVPGLACR